MQRGLDEGARREGGAVQLHALLELHPAGEAIFAGEGKKAREETDQAAIVFGDGGGQVVIGNFAGNATQCRERMHVTTDKGFKTLAVGELQIQHTAVRFD